MTNIQATLERGLASRSRSFPVFFLATGLVFILFSAGEAIRYRDLLKALALFGAGILALGSAAVLVFAERLSALGARLWQYTLAVVALAWCLWGGLIAYTHHIDGWDEGAYFLSGMALHGYDVPYAAHRAPVTSFLCAAFFGFDRFLNPVLLAVLLATVYLWVRRLLGPLPAALSLFVLLCQNLLLKSSVDIMSELPAALLLLLGFYSLARERFWWSALWFTLVVFARWNLAPIWGVVFLAVLIRFGIRHALKFVGVGLAVFSAWYAITLAMGTPDPLLRVYQYNFLPGLAWAPDASQKPNFRIRLLFYGRYFFFLTPPVLLALVANPIYYLRKNLRTEYWIPLVVLPLALLAYLVTMLFMGGLFSRFVTPLVPSAVVSLLVGLSKFGDDFSLPALSRLRLATLAMFLACAVGLWPLSAVRMAHANHNTPAVFSADLRKRLIELDRTVPLHGVPREPLSSSNGHPAMAEARHRILFPSARRDFNSLMFEEPDSAEMVRKLAAACHRGDLLLIPKKYASVLEPAPVLSADDQWALVRNP